MIWMDGKVTRQDMVVLYLNKYVNVPRNGLEMPVTMTQDGIACALGMSRSHVSNILGILEEKGLVEHEYAHSGGSRGKRRIYYLLPSGIMEVPGIRERMESGGMSPERFCRETYPGGRVPLNVMKANAELRNAVEAMERLIAGEDSGRDVLRSVSRVMELLVREAI